MVFVLLTKYLNKVGLAQNLFAFFQHQRILEIWLNNFFSAIFSECFLVLVLKFDFMQTPAFMCVIAMGLTEVI